MGWNFNKYRSEKLYRRFIQVFGSRFYIDRKRDPGKSIFIAGTARSGTTWLADLISSQIPCRLMFEPFNSKQVSEYQAFEYFQYMRPGQPEDVLFTFANRVFTGEIRNRWIDRKNENFLPQFRLIKEIRANLLLKWLHDSFPEVPFLFIIRHPCAVVHSRMELGWATDQDIDPFLKQPNLISDHLSNHIDFIQSVASEEEKHALVWCISNLVPLKQFCSDSLRIIFYENICIQPEEELSKIIHYLQHHDKPLRMINANKPSTTSLLSSAVVAGKDKLTRWTKNLSTEQVNRILNVVTEFGLDYLYGESTVPLERKNQA
jgi:hypothetical protein